MQHNVNLIKELGNERQRQNGPGAAGRSHAVTGERNPDWSVREEESTNEPGEMKVDMEEQRPEQKFLKNVLEED